MSDYGLNKAIGIALGLLLAGGIGSVVAWTNNSTQEPQRTPQATLRYEFGGVTYSYEQTNAAFEYDTPNPDWVTRWVTYPAVTEAAQPNKTQAVEEWKPTAQAPGLSTLAPWQTPNPTLICVTSCN